MNALSFHPYRLPLSKPYRWARGVQTHRTGFVVRLARDGVAGWGEAALLPHVAHDPHAFARQCEFLLDGLHPLGDGGDFLARLDERECPPAVRCAVSTAYFSYQAAARGQRLADFLGGAAQGAVRVNALVTDATPAQCVQAVREHAAAGIRTIKLKCGTDRRADLERVAAIRGAFADITLRIDPNQCWSADWAAEHLRALEPFGIQYCEEPLPPGTPFSSYRRLRERGGVPIALDESIDSRHAAQLAIDHGAADFLVLKLQRLGGADRLLDVAACAHAHGVPSVLTSSMETTIGLAAGLHVAAALPASDLDAGLATAGFFAENLAPPLPVLHGCIALPRGPGLGVGL